MIKMNHDSTLNNITLQVFIDLYQDKEKIILVDIHNFGSQFVNL